MIKIYNAQQADSYRTTKHVEGPLRATSNLFGVSLCAEIGNGKTQRVQVDGDDLDELAKAMASALVRTGKVGSFLDGLRAEIMGRPALKAADGEYDKELAELEKACALIRKWQSID